MRSLGVLTATIALSFLYSACSTISPGAPVSPESLQSEDRSAQVQQLTRKVAERDRALQSMQTEAVMEYTSPDRHPPKVREQITAKRPDSLRVEAMSAFSVALILATSGKHLAIFEPSRNKLVRAAATADTLNQFIQIPMAPADAVTLLLGIAPDSAALAERKPDSIAAEDDMTVASWTMADSTRRELGFGNDQLAMVRRRSATGGIEYEVRYSQYQDLGGLMFPYVVEATFPVAQSRVAFHYKRPIINGEVPDSAFVLSPPAANQQADANP
jgi:outer membrane lipoprotein-sorting protein